MLSFLATKVSQLTAPAVLGVPEFITDHFNWILGGAIVLVGLLVGMKDLLRFSGYRSWAISSVSFSESIRRRVLLITPVAILAIIIVSQLQNPVDAADAIRQTIKVALFATGMVVVIATIIMACTNLPKEIDNRVIYTVVTKPTTRLEIVVGKVLGFAKVSALLLLIMGLFTWGYVQFRAWNFGREIRTILAEGKLEDQAGRATMEHYAKEGLLSAKQYEWADGQAVLSRVPAPGESARWVFGRGEQDILVPFSVQPGELIGPGYEQISQEMEAIVLARIDYVQHEMTPEELKAASEEGMAVDLGGLDVTTEGGPLAPGATKPTRPAPRVAIQFLDRNRNSLLTSQSVNGGKPITLPPKGQPVEARLTGEGLAQLAKAEQFFVQITGLSPATEYGLAMPANPDDPPVRILIPGTEPGKHVEVKPASGEGKGMHAEFRGRLGTDGQQLRGGEPGKVPVAMYSFRGAELNPRGDGTVAFEFTSSIEKGGDEPAHVEIPTRVQVTFADAKTGQTGEPVELSPESNRTAFFAVPAGWLGGGDFDVIIRALTGGHWITVRSDGLTMVVKDQAFAFNLFKSLLVMWLLSLLVIVVSLFTSTFLSWPIAIVLTLVILLGKWGVDQLGDSAGSGLGNQVATDMGFRDPSTAKVVSTSVEALNRFLTTVSSILPDIGAFGGTDFVERGISIPPADVYRALLVLLAFGIPLVAMSYVFLKNKEVAP